MEAGWNVLVVSRKELIVQMAHEFNPDKPQRNVFGDGKTSEKIVERLRRGEE